MNQRDFLKLFTSTALLLSFACVHVAYNSIRLDKEIPDTGASITTEKGKTVVSVPAAFATPPPAKTERQKLEEDATTAAMLCGVPTDRAFGLIQRESNWKVDAVSEHGAVGLTQIKPNTAKEVSETLNVYVPFQNLLAGLCYLHNQFVKTGSWEEALYNYHAGPNRETTSQQTRDYAADILLRGGNSQPKAK